MSKLTHLRNDGAAHMVDISDKSTSRRRARATGKLIVQPETIRTIRDNTVPKGDVIATARIAAIMAAKDTARLIPLCHPLPLSHLSVDIDIDDTHLRVTATAETTGRTGVEMEALTAVTTGLLTLYDMLKAIDKAMRIDAVQLIEKRGGKSDFRLPDGEYL